MIFPPRLLQQHLTPHPRFSALASSSPSSSSPPPSSFLACLNPLHAEPSYYNILLCEPLTWPTDAKRDPTILPLPIISAHRWRETPPRELMRSEGLAMPHRHSTNPCRRFPCLASSAVIVTALVTHTKLLRSHLPPNALRWAFFAPQARESRSGAAIAFVR